jgi:hypothetical protein
METISTYNPNNNNNNNKVFYTIIILLVLGMLYTCNGCKPSKGYNYKKQHKTLIIK